MHTAIYEFNTGKELLDITKDIKTVEITITKNSNDSTKYEALIATKKRNEALLKIDEPYT